MKHLVFQSENQWQIDLVQNLLLNEQIESVPMLESRDYSQIVTGMGQAQIKLYVHDENAEKAQQIVKRYLSSQQISLVTDEPKEPEENKKTDNKNYFSRLLFFSFTSFFFLPLIFNLLATYSYVKLLQQPVSTNKKGFALFVLIFSWIGVAYEIFWFVNIYMMS